MFLKQIYEKKNITLSNIEIKNANMTSNLPYDQLSLTPMGAVVVKGTESTSLSATDCAIESTNVQIDVDMRNITIRSYDMLSSSGFMVVGLNSSTVSNSSFFKTRQ